MPGVTVTGAFADNLVSAAREKMKTINFLERFQTDTHTISSSHNSPLMQDDNGELHWPVARQVISFGPLVLWPGGQMISARAP